MTDMQAPTTDRQIVGDPAVDARPASVAAQFRQDVAASGAKEAFRWPEGDTWRSATWRPRFPTGSIAFDRARILRQLPAGDTAGPAVPARPPEPVAIPSGRCRGMANPRRRL